MDQLEDRPDPPPGFTLMKMPNGALIVESPASTAVLVTNTDAHPHSMMLRRLLSAMRPNKEPIVS